jgi:hypothetical protein
LLFRLLHPFVTTAESARKSAHRGASRSPLTGTSSDRTTDGTECSAATRTL